MAIQNKAQEVLGYLGAIQTLTEKFPMNFKINYIEFPTSFDFMIDVLKLLGVSNRELVQKVGELVADDKEGGFLDILDGIVKTVLKLNVSKLLSCEANPFIPDTMIGPSSGNDNTGYLQLFRGEQYGSNYLHGGFDVDVALLDVMGYLRHSPLSEEGKYLYNDSDYKVNDLYKSTDFNTFLWYVINKGMSAPEKERQKLTWDNRRLGMTDPEKWFKGEDSKKKKIIDIVYRENGTTATNKINIKINPETYYKTGVKILGTTYNKTIFEFNNDYLNSLKLFDSKVILTNLVDIFTGGGLNVSIGYSLNEKMIMAQVDKIIKNVEKTDDTEVEDCYFSFSNDEFNDMLEQSEMEMMGLKMMNGEFQQPYAYDTNKLLSSLDAVSSAATLQEKTAAIENLFFNISATPATEGGIECTDALTFGYDTGLLAALLRAIIYPIVRVIFSPKVMLMFYINAQVMGNTIPSFNDFIYGIFNIIKNLIKQIKDLLLEYIFKWLVEKLKVLLQLFASQILLETLSEYRALLEIMLDCIFWFKTNKVLTAIDDVNYADIIPTKESPDDKKC